MSKRLNILIVDDLHPALMDGLRDLNLDVSYHPDIKAREISAKLKGYNAIILRSKINIDSTFLTKNSHLVLVARAGAGMDNIDEKAAAKLDITCMNAGEGNRNSVAEHAIGMLLSLTSRITKSNREVRLGVWDREGNRGTEIGGKTVGIIGFGNTGSAMAERLAGFGCRILAYDKYKSGFGTSAVNEVGYSTILQESDIISFHIPLTLETKNWINSKFIDKVRKPFVLLNTSRGGLMNSAHIIDGLKQGKIVAFGSDVLENENMKELSDKQLSELKLLNEFSNVILTPHVAGWTQESYKNISLVLLKKLADFMAEKEGKTLHFNKEGHYVG